MVNRVGTMVVVEMACLECQFEKKSGHDEVSEKKNLYENWL